ncbi:hypothetical protein BZG73_01800 [Salinivibrio siamensis]|uniref:Response regulatory domain-containing protein n=1 Tax=Salinivibrio siamensis TaxID=414286 RepID=A0ABX3KEU0_9GAMM|nr:hypothetical protein [Salinivibrio siamensis]OOE87398.1 hypothetical protein BZG73_01800 [Salinivibrio siamensis]
MIIFPSIVLIDDKKEDLDSIQDSLVRAGYPCFPIHYKKDEPSNLSGVDHINFDKVHPRVIITDLNLQELQVNAKSLVGPIADILRKITIDGPYLLFFWSKNTGTVKEVMDLIEERYADIPYPIHWGVLDKAQFNTPRSNLKDEVVGILSSNPIFESLFGWENRVSSAAQLTTDSLFRLARSRENNIEKFQHQTTENLKTMLGIIGNETLGFKNAREEPDVAIELGLEPVLHNHIRSNHNKAEHSSWVNASKGIGQKPDNESYQDIKAYLNTFYHIDELSNGSLKNKRGTWIEFNKTYLDENELKVESNLGRNIKTVMNEEFLNCRKGTKKERSVVREATQLGFIELSAECDQAQRKTKLNRYFLSAMIPKEHEKFTFFGDQSGRDTAHAGIYRLPNVIIKNEEYIVKVSFMYQLGARPDVNKWLGTPIFKLKDQILSDISFRASQHAARPGIIRFD